MFSIVYLLKPRKKICTDTYKTLKDLILELRGIEFILSLSFLKHMIGQFFKLITVIVEPGSLWRVLRKL